MAERRPDLAREHRLHDRFRGPPRASPVRFQVSRPADRTSRGWARGVPLAECRFLGPATRRLGRLRRESERSTQNGRAKTLCGGGGGAHTNSELPQAGFPESGSIYVCSCSSLSQVGPPIVEPPGIQSSSRPACARMSASASAFLSRSACWLQGSGGQAA